MGIKTRRRPLLGYVTAVGFTVAVFAARYLLTPVIGERVPMLPFIPCVMLAGYLGGFWPGVIATGIGTALAPFFMPPLNVWGFDDPSHWVSLAIFAAVGVWSACLSEGIIRRHEEIEEYIGRKDRFLATLAHELRNPLTPVQYGIEIIEQSESEPERQEMLKLMRQQVNYLIRMIDDLLDISRIRLNKFLLNRSMMDLCEAARFATDSVRAPCDLTGHIVDLVVPSEAIMVYGDRVRLVQAISNLLLNACRHAGENCDIRITVKEDGEFAYVSVADNGVGISQEIIKEIFEEFVQGDEVRKRAEGGLGIGLTLVKQIVDLHGGRVEARSDGLLKGCVFTIGLPLNRPFCKKPSGELRLPALLG